MPDVEKVRQGRGEREDYYERKRKTETEFL